MSDDPRRRFLRALSRELGGGPLARRRVVREIAGHLDDLVAELEERGLTKRAAVEEALRRLGDVGTITTAFREVRPPRRHVSRLRSPAWIAVGAMSLVTAWAAELPQASGARATTRVTTGSARATTRVTSRSARARTRVTTGSARATTRATPAAAARHRVHPPRNRTS